MYAPPIHHHPPHTHTQTEAKGGFFDLRPESVRQRKFQKQLIQSPVQLKPVPIQLHSNGCDCPACQGKLMQGKFRGRVIQRNVIWWYDLTEGQQGWKESDPALLTKYRPANDYDVGKDGANKDAKTKGYDDPSLIPFYIKKKTKRALRSGHTKLEGEDDPGIVNLPQKERNVPIHSHRNAMTRMLDRMGRVMLEGMSKSHQTPHLAVAMIGGKLHIAGNTGKRYVTDKQKTDAWNKVVGVAKGTDTSSNVVDQKKLQALTRGDYQKSHPDLEDDLNELQKILQTGKPDPVWKNVGIKSPNKGKSAVPGKSTTGSIHGEMELLNNVKAQIQKDGPNKLPVTVPFNIGGIKRDCIWCHYAYEVFNDKIAKPAKYEVRSGGTHANPYPGWQAPKWMLDTSGAETAMKTEVDKVKGFVFNTTTHTVDKEKVKTGTIDMTHGAPGGSHEGYESGSDVEDEI